MNVENYNQLFADAGKQYGVDPLLLMAQAKIESEGNPNAIGPETKYGRAKGIAQLIPSTAQALGVTNPFDPNQAIPAQAKLMAENLQRYKDPKTAVLAYHGGTDKNNWGPKTQKYAEKVMAQYQPQPEVDEDEAIFAQARKELAEENKASPSAENVDSDEAIFAQARKELAQEQQAKIPKAPPMSVGEDLAKTTASLPFKAIGMLPQIPAMAGNAVANAVGYSAGKLMGASPAEQEKLNTINPFFTGNTPFDALTQAGKAIAYDDPGKANPLTGDVLHEPETMPGRFENMVGLSAVGGPATGLKLFPSITGGLGAQTATEMFPNNPLAPVVGGLAGGAAPSAVKSLQLRSTPEQLASNALQNFADDGNPPGGGGGGGGGSNALRPQDINSTELVPGSRPTLAQITQNPNIALVERQLQAKNPAAFKAVEDLNEAARQQHFEKASGTAQDIQVMEAAREAQRAANTADIFKPEQVADPSPVLSKIDEILNGPGGKRDAVKATLNNIRSKIVEETPDGQQILETNPETLYRSVQKQIADLLDTKDLTNSSGRQASRELLQVKEVLDNVIDKASPGFQKYLDDYSQASANIDAARWLQGLKLTDASGRYTLAKVKNALDNVNKLKNTPGINEAKNITPEQLKILEDLHADLHRRENVARASMPRGSNTVQNALVDAKANTALGKANAMLGGDVPEMIGTILGAKVGATMGAPGAGSYVGNMAGRYFQNIGQRRTAAATNALQNFVLTPENYKQFLLDNASNNFLDRLKGNLLANP